MEINVKYSSFKRPAAFLEHLQQLGLLQLQEKSNGVLSIINIQREHEWFRGVKHDDPESYRASVLAESGTEHFDLSGPSVRGMNNHDVIQKERMHVVDLFKLTKAWTHAFPTVKGQFGTCLSASEVSVLYEHDLISTSN